MSYSFGMETNELSIGELADVTGVSPRTVRFYVQEKLLAPPEGAGRGSHYTRVHLEQLRRIAELQRAGHALDAIRRILRGEDVPAPSVRAAQTAPMAASLVSRIELVDGVELFFDAGKFSPDAEGLLALRELAHRVFGR
jgi:DNA-binding transcriptional MerR regulator